jgi:hypothetical protein
MYEKIQEIAEMAEMQEIAALVEARKNSTKTYPLEEVLNEHGKETHKRIKDK